MRLNDINLHVRLPTGYRLLLTVFYENDQPLWPGSRCTVYGENAGKHTAIYSAPSGFGLL